MSAFAFESDREVLEDAVAVERVARGEAEVERDRLAGLLAKERVLNQELENALRSAKVDLAAAQSQVTEHANRAAQTPYFERAAESFKQKAEALAVALAAAEGRAAEALARTEAVEAELGARDSTIAEQAAEIESARVLVDALHKCGTAVDVIAAELRRSRG